MKSTFPPAEYQAAFERERVNAYPAIDELEARSGYALERSRLEIAAKHLACPVKRNPPNWQHGRVIYALLRRYLAARTGFVSLLDIGTAKGFSALCMAFALADAGMDGAITSLDVVDPDARVPRNSIAECEELKTVAQFVSPWQESRFIAFRQSTGAAWLVSDRGRVHFAFVDGKHEYRAVREEAELLARRQEPGDIALFDDLQIAGVERAVRATRGYAVAMLEAKRERRYAIATRQ